MLQRCVATVAGIMTGTVLSVVTVVMPVLRLLWFWLCAIWITEQSTAEWQSTCSYSECIVAAVGGGGAGADPSCHWVKARVHHVVLRSVASYVDTWVNKQKLSLALFEMYHTWCHPSFCGIAPLYKYLLLCCCFNFQRNKRKNWISLSCLAMPTRLSLVQHQVKRQRLF